MTQQVANNVAKKNGVSSTAGGIEQIKDYVQACIISVFLVQKLGQPTALEVQSAARERLNAKMDIRLIERALKGAASRSLIAVWLFT